MKNQFSLLVLALLALQLPLRAQSEQETGGNPAPPPRNIMQMTINPKPNPTTPPPEIAAAIDKFYKGLKAGDYANSYETFLTGTRLGEQKEKMSVFISKTQEAFGIYGALNDYEIYDNYAIGSNVLILTYLSRHSLQPLVWRFIYYRADKTWSLINLGIDDGLLGNMN